MLVGMSSMFLRSTSRVKREILLRLKHKRLPMTMPLRGTSIEYPAALQKIEETTLVPAAGSTAIDARIAAFARTGATINIPDARLPAVLRGLPSALGTAGQVLAVNSGATALEFADAASGDFVAEW